MLGKGTEFNFFLDHNKQLYIEGQAEHPGLVGERKVLARLAGGRGFLPKAEVRKVRKAEMMLGTGMAERRQDQWQAWITTLSTFPRIRTAARRKALRLHSIFKAFPNILIMSP